MCSSKIKPVAPDDANTINESQTSMSENAPIRKGMSTSKEAENTGEYKGLHGNTGDYRGIQGNTRDYRGIQGNTRDYRRIQAITGEYKGIQGITGE